MEAGSKVSICGYNFDKGGITRGSHEGPTVIRDRGLLEKLGNLGLEVTDLGDLSNFKSDEILFSPSQVEKDILSLGQVFAATKGIYSLVNTALESNSLPIVLGGDHSVSIGSVAAVSDYYHNQNNEKIGLIWIDTHSDINLPDTSPSNRAFGMSVACLSGMIPGCLSPKKYVDPENIAYIGLRDVDPPERKIIAKNKIFAKTIKDIDLEGLATVVSKAIDVASKDTAGFVVSFDLDVCDPAIVPGTQTPIRGGLTFREAHLLVELLQESGKLLSFELVELNPLLDKDFQTADLSVSLIESAMGSSLL